MLLPQGTAFHNNYFTLLKIKIFTEAVTAKNRTENVKILCPFNVLSLTENSQAQKFRQRDCFLCRFVL